MKPVAKKSGLMLSLALLLLLALVFAPSTSARAAAEDVAMFYDALTAYGTWVDYGNYGPVWYPSQGVTANWRPYVDGRWGPTAEGWVFESSEPWAWATYHWGNWMPTSEYGWVWVPGSTWYPSTAAWRTSDDYIGWAPIPPTDYVPEPAYYPAGGYYPGMPLLDLISAPFWIFAQVANFLLGFGEPFIPGYSYYNCGCLAPFSYGPVALASTMLLADFYYPFYAPGGFYCYGPAFPFVSRVCNVNIAHINNFARNANFSRMRNVLPPDRVMNRHPFIRDAVPAAVREGRGFQVTRAANPATVERHLANPRAVPAPAKVPKLTKKIPPGVTPKAQPAAKAEAPGVATPRPAPKVPQVTTAPGRERQVPQFYRGGAETTTRPRGTTFPPPSTHELTPPMQRQVQQYQRAPSTFRPSAPAFRASAPRTPPTSHVAPSAPRPAPAPAPRPSAPAPPPSGAAPRGEEHHH
jgi:hypothetical protein